MSFLCAMRSLGSHPVLHRYLSAPATVLSVVNGLERQVATGHASARPLGPTSLVHSSPTLASQSACPSPSESRIRISSTRSERDVFCCCVELSAIAPAPSPGPFNHLSISPSSDFSISDIQPPPLPQAPGIPNVRSSDHIADPSNPTRFLPYTSIVPPPTAIRPSTPHNPPEVRAAVATDLLISIIQPPLPPRLRESQPFALPPTLPSH